MQKTQRGFTFIEILVTTIIIGVLAGILMVSYVAAGRFIRDARRKKDLANVQAALEFYKSQHHEYPDASTCGSGGGWSWPECMTPWIPGLSPTYMGEMPRDPKQNYAGRLVGASDEETYTYNYIRTGVNTYQLVTRLENTNDAALNGSLYGYDGEGIYVLSEPK